MEMILSPEQLNKIWVRWLDGESLQYENPNYMRRQYHDDYSRVARPYGLPKKFEDWLWEHGGTVQQVNHKRHIYFADESRALMFALTKL